VHTGRRWYLVAWDPTRDDWRTFRIDRIADAPVTGAHFAPRAAPEGGDLRTYVSRSLAVSPFAEQAQVVFHQPHEAMARRIPPSAGVLEALEDGRCLLTCGTHDLDWLAGWLLMVDVEFEVRSPAALVERLRAAGERIASSLARGSEPPRP
jgi:predicted DNA-binding transcriptional regulator YafY